VSNQRFAWQKADRFFNNKNEGIEMKKKLLAALMAIVFMFSLTACGNSSEQDQTSGDDTPESFTIGICQLLQHPALDLATEGFIDAVKAQLGDTVVIDTKNASGEPSNCATIVAGFVNDEVDLIMANATPALSAAESATSEIPILGTSITEYGAALGIENFSGVSGRNISGTSDLAPLEDQAQMILDLFPDTKKVGILFCSSEANSKYQVKVVRECLESKGITVNEFSFTDTNDIAAVAQQACDESDVLYIPTDNKAADCAETINNVAVVAGVPIIAGEEGICKTCGVATLTISYYDLGFETGLMAVEILKNGADISTMEIRYSPEFTKKYNPELAAKYGVTVGDDYVAIED